MKDRGTLFKLLHTCPEPPDATAIEFTSAIEKFLKARFKLNLLTWQIHFFNPVALLQDFVDDFLTCKKIFSISAHFVFL